MSNLLLSNDKNITKHNVFSDRYFKWQGKLQHQPMYLYSLVLGYYFFTISVSAELQVFQNSFLFNICESISKMIFFLASAEREWFVHLQVCLFSVPYGTDWTDFVKDSITFKETCNLTSDCILPSFYCHIFHHTYCFPTVSKLLIFLVYYICRPIYCL